MADHGHHDPGGHELEAINTKLLFRLLISLSLVTLLAALAVVQWFYSQRAELERRYAAEGSFQLQEYKAKMATDLEGMDRVAADLANKPERLAAPPAPSGWIHPDDLAGGPAATPAATAPADAVDAPIPVGSAPAEDAAPAAEDAPADEAAEAKPAPAAEAAPAAKPAPAAEAPAPKAEPKPAAAQPEAG
jgi:hypothetical protein